MKVVLLNGPARSGKDTAGEALLSFFGGEKMKFSDPVKEGTHASFGLDVPVDHFEDRKDEPAEEFFGMTPRAAYIDHSERYMKPVFGKDVFGKILARNLDDVVSDLVVIPDSGFEDEAKPVIEKVGPENVLLVTICRQGFDFTGDSRDYISLPNVRTVSISNTDREVFRYTVAGHVASWAGLKLQRDRPRGLWGAPNIMPPSALFGMAIGR